jgi:hypothetical protein
VNLIQFLEAPQHDLRVIAIKLLHLLSGYMGQELADGLRVTTRQLGTLVRLLGESSVTEEQAYAAGLLANLPMQDHFLTRALLSEGALPILVGRIEEVKRGVARVGVGRNIGPFQKGLVCILSRFTFVLDDADIVDEARKLDLTSLFTSLLRMSNLEEVQQSSAQALENLSTKSKQLSRLPEVTKQKHGLFSCFPCGKKPPPPIGLCPVHGGLCSARETFCLIEAQAIGPLVACLDHRNTSVVEAAMGALSTLLMDTTDVERGVQVCVNPILIHQKLSSRETSKSWSKACILLHIATIFLQEPSFRPYYLISPKDVWLFCPVSTPVSMFVLLKIW